MKSQKLENLLEQFVQALNPNWRDDPDMMGTPERLSRMYQHFFRNEDPKEHLSKKFPTDNNQMVIIKDIECFGMCPHHFLPVIYKVHIGYIPTGWALGLSKFARLTKALASYPKLQENLTTEITDIIYEQLQPKGVIATVEGVHGCMRCRGVEANSSVITSAIKGDISNENSQSKDFYDALKLA